MFGEGGGGGGGGREVRKVSRFIKRKLENIDFTKKVQVIFPQVLS